MHEPSPRLKGTLIRRHEARQTAKSEGLAAIARLGISVERGPDSQVSTLGPAEVVTDVSLGGLVHISKEPIDAFHTDKVGSNGKFGRGTYFAAGALTGETYDLLAASRGTVHAAEVSGTAMIIDRDKVKDLASTLRDASGMPESRLRTRIPNADITGLAPDGVDMLVVFMDTERTAAEVAVLPAAIEKIAIQDRRQLS